MSVKKHNGCGDLMLSVYTADGSSMKIPVDRKQNMHDLITEIVNHEGSYKYVIQNLDPRHDESANPENKDIEEIDDDSSE